MSEEIDLSLLSESFERVGKRKLDKKDLKEFALNTIHFEISNLKERIKMYKDDEIKEFEINEFPFYSDGYRYGIVIQMIDDNIYPASYKKGKDGKYTYNEKGNRIPIHIKRMYKKGKDGNYLSVNGKKVPTKRLLMRIKSRRGACALFIGESKGKYIEKEHHYVLIGGLSTQYKNKDTGLFEAKKEDSNEYEDRPSYTLNVWQIVGIEKKGKKLSLDLPDINWEDENE